MDGGNGLVGLLFKDAGLESLFAGGDFEAEFGLEVFPEFGLEPGGDGGVNDIVQHQFCVGGIGGFGSPDGVVGDESAASALVGDFNEVADEGVGAVLVDWAVGEPAVLEVVK